MVIPRCRAVAATAAVVCALWAPDEGALLLRHAHCQESAAAGLLVNPGFEAGVSGEGLPRGWTVLWTRDEGAGQLAVDRTVAHSGTASLKVSHSGARDWAVSQEAILRVEPLDVFAIGAWLRGEGLERAADISVVLRAADGTATAWMHGRRGRGGTYDWQRVEGRFIVPRGTATVQFRLTGSGPGTVWLDDASLVRIGNIAQMRTAAAEGRHMLENDAIRLVFDAQAGTFALTDKRVGRTWKQLPVGEAVVVTDVQQAAAGAALHIRLRDVVNDVELTATVALGEGPEARLTLDAPAEAEMEGDLAWPAPFVATDDCYLILPENEGMSYPVGDESIRPRSFVLYGGHGLCMSWWGVTDLGKGCMTIVEDPNDAVCAMRRAPVAGAPQLVAAPVWRAEKGRFGYPRRLRWLLLEDGGYVAMAKAYRAYAREIGRFVSIQDKLEANPKVDLLLGAPNVWTWERDKVAVCQRFRDAGVKKLLWSGGGSAEQIKAINAMGYLTSRYEIYQDTWPPDNPARARHVGYPDDVAWRADGSLQPGWVSKRQDGDYQGYVNCGLTHRRQAQESVPAELQEKPYRCRFIDTTCAAPLYECYNPRHPATRTQELGGKYSMLEYISGDLGLVLGTETGIDWSVPAVHYYEGMLSIGRYRLPDAGRNMIQYKPPTEPFLKFQIGPQYRLPLWELVYHDSVVAHWYWGDYNNKAPEVWDQRDLWNALYGTVPMWMFNAETLEASFDRFVESYRTTCPFAERVARDEMLSHEWLTEDHTVQQATWSSGVRMVVNFGDEAYRLDDGGEVAPMGFRIIEP
ncbi:MAG: glycoside hydrolase [Armatimonadota bacterium]